MKLIKWFLNLFPCRHKYLMVVNDQIEGEFEWTETRYGTPSGFAETTVFKRDRKYNGVVYLSVYYCYKCGEWYFCIVTPDGPTQHSQAYVANMSLQLHTNDELVELAHKACLNAGLTFTEGKWKRAK